MINITKHSGIYTLKVKQNLKMSLDDAWNYFSKFHTLDLRCDFYDFLTQTNPLFIVLIFILLRHSNTHCVYYTKAIIKRGNDRIHC